VNGHVGFARRHHRACAARISRAAPAQRGRLAVRTDVVHACTLPVRQLNASLPLLRAGCSGVNAVNVNIWFHQRAAKHGSTATRLVRRTHQRALRFSARFRWTTWRGQAPFWFKRVAALPRAQDAWCTRGGFPVPTPLRTLRSRFCSRGSFAPAAVPHGSGSWRPSLPATRPASRSLPAPLRTLAPLLNDAASAFETSLLHGAFCVAPCRLVVKRVSGDFSIRFMNGGNKASAWRHCAAALGAGALLPNRYRRGRLNCGLYWYGAGRAAAGA